MIENIPNASQMMIRIVYTLTAEVRVDEAVRELNHWRLSSAPVVDENGRLVGCFTVNHGVQALAGAALYDEPVGTVGDHMGTGVPSVEEGTDLLRIIDLFRNESLCRVPVVRDDRVVGMLTRRSILPALQAIRGVHEEPKNYPDYRQIFGLSIGRAGRRRKLGL